MTEDERAKVNEGEKEFDRVFGIVAFVIAFVIVLAIFTVFIVHVLQ